LFVSKQYKQEIRVIDVIVQHICTSMQNMTDYAGNVLLMLNEIGLTDRSSQYVVPWRLVQTVFST